MSAATGVCAVPTDARPCVLRRGRRASAVRREFAAPPHQGFAVAISRTSADLLIHWRLAITSRASRPAAAKPDATPADDGVRLHDNQRGAPVSPTSREGHPKESVACPEAASRRSVERRQLLPQREVFQNEFPVAAEGQRECADDHDQQFQHPVDSGWRWREIQLGRVLATVTAAERTFGGGSDS
jgi:hypothetical protein